MPAAIIPAAIGAAGAVGGGIASGKGAKKAAKIQQQAANQQLALQQRLYNENAARFSPDIGRGDQAAQRLQDILGLSGNAVDATALLRATPGYEFRLGEALRGVNSNAYARGLGNSGATMRALQATAQGIADQGFNTYVGQVGDVVNRGLGGKSSLAGVSQNYGNSANAVSQNAADTAANYQMFKSANMANTIGGLLRAGGQVFGSSYGGGLGGMAPGNPTGPVINNFGHG